MWKMVIVMLVGIFLSSGALVYSNGNVSLNLQNAKKSLVQAYDSFSRLIKEVG